MQSGRPAATVGKPPLCSNNSNYMKLKHLYIGLIGLLGVALAACSDDDDYKSAKVSGAQVYFSAELPAQIDVLKSENTVNIPLNRVDTKSAADIALTVTGAAGTAYTVPSTVSFAAGDTVANIQIKYNPAQVQYGKYDEITIALADSALTTVYGLSSYTFKIGATEWESLGIATYREDLVASVFNADNLTYDVEIEKNIVTEGVYRLVNPYGKGYPYNEPGDYDTSQDYYMTIHAEDPAKVWVEYERSGMAWSYGEFTFGSIVGYLYKNGNSIENIYATYPEFFGSMVNGVIYMPTGSMYLSMANYNNGARLTVNANGLFAVALPGAKIADYSATVSYGGKLTDAAEKTHILGDVVLGDDVASANVGLVATAGVNEYIDLLVSGEASPMETLEESGSVSFPADELEEGSYYIVAVTFDQDGNAQEAAVSKAFKYTTSSDANDWQAIYQGDYGFQVLWSASDDSPYPTHHTLYQSKKDKTRFKIAKWCDDQLLDGSNGVDFTFQIKSDGTLIVDNLNTGAYNSRYSEYIWVDDATKYNYDSWGDEAPEIHPGSYDEESGIFTFAVAYGLGEGLESGIFNAGFEEFLITDEAAKKRVGKAIKTAKKHAITKKLEVRELADDSKTLKSKNKSSYARHIQIAL